MYKIINRKKLVVTAVLDTLGRILHAPIGWLRRSPSPPDPESVREILVIRTAYVGDVVMALPILQPLKTRFPNAKITFLACHAAIPLLQTNPFIDDILAYTPFWFYKRQNPLREYLDFRHELRKRRFDMVIETRADIRDILFLIQPARATHKISYAVGGGDWMLTNVAPYPGLKHKIEYHLDIARHLGANVDSDAVEWGIYPTEAERREIRELLENCQVRKPFAVLHPGSRLPFKCWAPDKFADLANRIMTELDMQVLLVGAESEKPITESVIQAWSQQSSAVDTRRVLPQGTAGSNPAPSAIIDLAGRINLRQLGCLLYEAALFVGNDSGPMHLAAAAGIPTIGIFGPSKPVETAPFGKHCRAVAADFPCRETCDESHCRITPENACIIELDADRVWSAVVEVF
jgi:lipopolysaccharide heptosyltransferase II